MPVSFCELKVPYSPLRLAWNSLRLGLPVMKLITPPVALRPNKVPCGPRSTSTRSRSKYSFWKIGEPSTGTSLTWIAAAASHVTPTHKSPMPRMLNDDDEVKLLLVKV